MPPTVISSKTLGNSDVFRTGQVFSAIPHSDDDPIRMLTDLHSSQTYRTTSDAHVMTSTQVLPGPYGDRNNTTKGKTSKKRLGGF